MADRAIICRFDIPGRFALGTAVSVHCGGGAGECARPDEQHRNHDRVQYDWSSDRSAGREFRSVAGSRLSMESHPLRCRLRFAQHSRNQTREPLVAPACQYHCDWTLGRSHPDSTNFSVSTR